MASLERDLKNLMSLIYRMINSLTKVLDATSRILNEKMPPELRSRIRREIDDGTAILEHLRGEVVREVLAFIARRQPLGSDLVLAEHLINVAYDIFRISRYCREIARIDGVIAEGLAEIHGLSKLFETARRAVVLALEDFTKLRNDNQRLVEEYDSMIDEEYRRIIDEVASKSSVDRDTAFKLLIMRHIERILDHAVYIERYISELKR